MDVRLGSKGLGVANKVRSTLKVPLGLYRHHDSKAHKSKLFAREHSLCRDVYAFDSSTSTVLNEVPATDASEAFTVYTYGDYPFARKHRARFQIAALSISTLKLTEAWCLWRLARPLLAVVTVIPWTYFILFAVVVELHEIIISRALILTGGDVDVVAGQLPSTKKPGGSKKIFLGAVDDPRRHRWWRLGWVCGATLCTFSVVLTYFILAQQPTSITLLWTAFQALWFILRIVVYHFSSPSMPMAHRMVVKRTWDGLPEDMKERVLHLFLGIATYQIQNHPRESNGHVYGEDCLSAPLLILWIRASTSGSPPTPSAFSLLYPLSASRIMPTSGTRAVSVDVRVLGVIGDTALSTMAWMAGSKLAPMDVYDCCVLIFSRNVDPPRNPGTPSIVAVPAVRVLSCTSASPDTVDQEHNISQPMFIPRGASSQTGDIQTWHYWLPCDSMPSTSVPETPKSSSPTMWLHLQSDNVRIVGSQKAEVLSEFELDRRLAAGRLNIGLTGIGDVQDALELSRRVALLWWQWYGGRS